MRADCDQRHCDQEAALLCLLEQVKVLEAALRFEVSQREAMEEVLIKLAQLPVRMDRVEREIRGQRKVRPAQPGAAE